MNPETRSHLTLITAMKGAPASIFLILVLSGRAMLAQELETWTGYNHDSVTRGLRKLEHLGAIFNNGRRSGYCLNPGWRQLELFSRNLLATTSIPVDNLSQNLSQTVDNFSQTVDYLSQPEFECEKIAFKSSLSAKKSHSNCDHDHDHDDDDQVVDNLLKLTPPFDNAAEWLATQNRQLVNAWLTHLAELPEQTQSSIKNQSAFIRAKVTTGRWPPKQRSKKKDPSRYRPN